MIKCPFCNTLHIPNTVFCSECGHYLLEMDQRVTEPMDGPDDSVEKHGLVNGEEKAGVSHTIQTVSLPRSVRLKIDDGRREIEVRLDRPIHIGRVDPATNIFPEINIRRDDPHANLVSRRHVRLFNQKNILMVEDLGSINGTFLNGKRLPPFVPESVADGDSLQLGALMMTIEFSRR